MDNRTRMVTFVSGDITLEGVLHLLEQPPSPGVLICHPHPLYGGNMHNNVVTAISGALVEKGLAALRFNFRGVGGSEGSYANGVGEQQDVAAGIAYLRQLPEIDPSSVGVAGYSFGAIQALYAGAEAPRAIAAISTPTSGLDLSGHFLPVSKHHDWDHIAALRLGREPANSIDPFTIAVCIEVTKRDQLIAALYARGKCRCRGSDFHHAHPAALAFLHVHAKNLRTTTCIITHLFASTAFQRFRLRVGGCLVTIACRSPTGARFGDRRVQRRRRPRGARRALCR